jgi:hypothetical protein
MAALSSVEYATKFIRKDYPHVLEFGVWVGTSMGKMKKLLPDSYKVYGFDSFEGLPEDWVDHNGKLVGSGKKGRFDTKGQVPNIKGVKWMKGWFSDTIPVYLKEAKDIALLHVDCDLYSSTKEVLWGLNDYIKEGTVIVFDEWFYNHKKAYNDHEQKAFYEWVKDFDREFEFIDYTDPTDSKKKGGQKYETSERKIVKIVK